jgi:hypothetical protein
MTPTFADVTLSNQELTLTVVLGIAGLLAALAVVTAFIRNTAGVKDTQRVELVGQPIEGRHEKQHVERHDHDAFKSEIKAAHDSLWEVVNGLRLSISSIQANIAAIRAMREANGERLTEIAHQVESLSKSVHTLTGAVNANLKGSRG